jgi:hypothetical protein
MILLCKGLGFRGRWIIFKHSHDIRIFFRRIREVEMDDEHRELAERIIAEKRAAKQGKTRDF